MNYYCSRCPFIWRWTYAHWRSVPVIDFTSEVSLCVVRNKPFATSWRNVGWFISRQTFKHRFSSVVNELFTSGYMLPTNLAIEQTWNSWRWLKKNLYMYKDNTYILVLFLGIVAKRIGQLTLLLFTRIHTSCTNRHYSMIMSHYHL